MVDRKLPSPSLLICCRGGNSHSIRGHDGMRGLDIADLIDEIAALLRSVFEVGILADPDCMLKRYLCVNVVLCKWRADEMVDGVNDNTVC